LQAQLPFFLFEMKLRPVLILLEKSNGNNLYKTEKKNEIQKRKEKGCFNQSGLVILEAHFFLFWVPP